MQKPNFSLHGAVDLGARAAAAKAQQERAAQGPAPDGGQYVIEVTDATFNTDVVERSLQIPVMVDFWSERSASSIQIQPLLEKLAGESGGAWILAKVNADLNPSLAQYVAQMGVRNLPFVGVVVQGQMMPFLNGPVTEQELRAATDELWAALKEQGLMGETPEGAELPEAEAEEADPVHAAAEEALGRGDFEAAAQAFRDVLAADPRDETAKRRLALTELTIRVKGYDQEQVEADPLKAADLRLLQGDPEGAFQLLIDRVRATAGEDRDAARVHLLALFETLGSDDPRVAKARRSLQSALF
ncbi:tetratricopeptide repeat protein [Actinocorallia longicatena]|uniref:Tetratricopeptide repeat protein n=1 Tax=Actinocorallia longicatena TaxID=111803 RepID=A0ABP6QIY6_9ACTN